MRPEILDPALPVPLQQSPLFQRALGEIGRDCAILNLNNAGQALVMERRFGLVRLRLCSRGPLWRDDAVATDRVAALRDAPINLINAASEDDAVLRAAGFRMIVTPATQAILPLCADPDAQLAQARSKWRNAARQGQRSDLRIIKEPLTPALLGWFLVAERLQQTQKRYRAVPTALTRALIAADPASATLIAAKRGNTCHAAMLFFSHGTMATYHLGWSDARGRAAPVHHAMILSAARTFAGRGIKALDLGQIDTTAAPGLARFKIGSGARITPMGGTWLRLRPWR